MISKTISPHCGQVRVAFELPSCIWADRIYVSGDFNHWSETETRMRQGRDSVWRAEVDLPANRQFEFRYVIDGKWQTDSHADGSRPNQYGSENSVVDTGVYSMENPAQAGAHQTVVVGQIELAQGSLVHEGKQGLGRATRLVPAQKVMQAAA